MVPKSYKIWEEGEYGYSGYGNFLPTITAYLHEDDDKKRPAVLIVPGGGYYMVCPWEGESVAEAFCKKGYQTFVLTYTTNFRYIEPLGMQPLKDLSRAVVFLRKHADRFGVDSSKIAILGFSAGGHLCGSLAVHYVDEYLKETGEYRGISNRPDAVVLCYPLITTEERYTHKDSLYNLLGADASSSQLEYMSLERHVSGNTPPVFMWHTVTDELAPVENSILFTQACINQGISVELHLFGTGLHGLSLADNLHMTKDLSSLYCMKQFFEALPDLIEIGESVPGLFDYTGQSMSEIEKIKTDYFENTRRMQTIEQTDEEIAMWPELVHKWLKRLFQG